MSDLLAMCENQSVPFIVGTVMSWGLTYWFQVKDKTTQIEKLKREISNLDKDGVLKLAQLAKDIEERENTLHEKQEEASRKLAQLRDAIAAKQSSEDIRHLRDEACHVAFSDVHLAFSQYLRFKVLEYTTDNARKEEFINTVVIPEIKAWQRWLLVLNNESLFLSDGVSKPFLPKRRDYAEIQSLATDIRSETLKSMVRAAISEFVREE